MTCTSHFTTQAMIVGQPETHDPKCDNCGRSMREIREERAAKVRAPRAKRIDARTPVMKECDNERRRNRYHRTGR